MMTRFLLPLVSLPLVCSPMLAQSAETAADAEQARNEVQRVGPPGEGSYSITEAGPHSRRWEQIVRVEEDEENTNIVTSSYIELATGLNRLDNNGRWVPAEAVFELVDGAAVASKTAHKVVLTSPTAALPVDLIAPDGNRFTSRVIGIAYYSAKSGESVMIAEVKPTQGKLTERNEVIYENCFDGGFQADLRYTVSLSGLEQDVIFREQPNPPSDYGMDASDSSVRLELLTEFLNSRQPIIQESLISGETDLAVRAQMIEPDLIDETLWFGGMNIGSGTAFALDSGLAGPATGIQTAKHWQVLDGRNVLFESIRLDQAWEVLTSLPAKPQAGIRKTSKRAVVASRSKLLPAISAPSQEPIIAAQINPTKGFCLDYKIVNGALTNFTFEGDKTYLVRDVVQLYLTTTLEGGAVIKYTNYPNSAGTYPYVAILGAVTCKTGPYRPIVFTSMDDNSIGEVISESSGTPTNYYGYAGLFFNNGATAALSHILVRYAKIGLDLSHGSGHLLQDAQFVKCDNAFVAVGTDFTMRNVLCHQPNSAFVADTSSVVGEHMTIRDGNYFQSYYTNSTYNFTNSLFAGVSGVPTLGGLQNVVTNTAGVFASVAAGSNYLAVSSPYRDFGVSTINPGLLAALQQRTTYPPIVLSNTFTVPTSLSPQAGRDTTFPDVGYNYVPLDYIFTGATVTNTTLTLTNGVAIGTYGDRGIYLQTGARLFSEGSPLNLVKIGHINRVQEQPSLVSGSTNYSSLECSATSAPRPEVHGAHTDFSMMSGSTLFNRYLVQSVVNNPLSVADFANCYFRGAYLELVSSNSAATPYSFRNNLFERATWTINQDTSSRYPFTLSLLNNLFGGGTNAFIYSNTNSVWDVRDNLFDSDAISQTGFAFSARTNGYRAGLASLTGDISTRTNLVMDFQGGPITNSLGYLGNFYYPAIGGATSLTNLLNRGTRSASLAGLYHYTTQTNQTKEASSIVDIGFHYVALNSGGNPNDADSDGFPDYFEDTNGNGGLPDSGETDWNRADDLGLQVFITEPKGNSNVP